MTDTTVQCHRVIAIQLIQVHIGIKNILWLEMVWSKIKYFLKNLKVLCIIDGPQHNKKKYATLKSYKRNTTTNRLERNFLRKLNNLIWMRRDGEITKKK